MRGSAGADTAALSSPPESRPATAVPGSSSSLPLFGFRLLAVSGLFSIAGSFPSMPSVLSLGDSPDISDAVHRAVQALVEGHVIGLPTDTVYGLAASALCESAVERIYELKGRQDQSPLAVSVASYDAARDFFCELPESARRMASRGWPGPITLVVPCGRPDSAVSQLPPGVRRHILGPGDCVGFRVVDQRVLKHLHHLVSAPIVLTSANLSGNPAPKNADEVMRDFAGVAADKFPLLLDDGPTRYGGASTVVRVTERGTEILRSGVLDQAAMQQLAKPVVAIVCTGNTCRSPMAETLLREMIRKRFGHEDAIRVVSAGLAAAPGALASSQAVEVMGRRDLDLTGHAARPLSDDIVHLADVILTMTEGHRRAILAAWPQLNDRVFPLRSDGGDVADPVGGPVSLYVQCAEQIESELQIWMQRWEEAWFRGDEFADEDAADDPPEASPTESSGGGNAVDRSQSNDSSPSENPGIDGDDQ